MAWDLVFYGIGRTDDNDPAIRLGVKGAGRMPKVAAGAARMLGLLSSAQPAIATTKSGWQR